MFEVLVLPVKNKMKLKILIQRPLEGKQKTKIEDYRVEIDQI